MSEKEWVPVTKLGRLVDAGDIKKLEDIYLFSLPIKEAAIIDKFIQPSADRGGGGGMGDRDDNPDRPTMKDEVMKVMPVQKQTSAGQRTRFKAFVAVGDQNGHVGLGSKCAKEVAGAIQGAIIAAKLSVIPIRRGYWGNKIGAPHTVPCKLTGKCGSVRMRLIPAPKGTGIVAAIAPKKILKMAGIEDCYTASRGKTRTMGNFIKATFYALSKSYGFLTPNFWEEQEITVPHPYSEEGAKKEAV